MGIQEQERWASYNHKKQSKTGYTSYSQEEGIDCDKAFAPVGRMEAIRIFFAFAIYMNFRVYQMDDKSTFLNGKLKEEIYVKQHLGFEISEFPNYVVEDDRVGTWQRTPSCTPV
nr:retrovirus-related Pol polyprotein from transposon TNT 1-94 [Tanacetum cinerariifolium]